MTVKSLKQGLLKLILQLQDLVGKGALAYEQFLGSC